MMDRWMVDGIEIDTSGIKQKCVRYSADERGRLELAIESAERRSRREIVYFAICNGRSKILVEGGFAISMLQGPRKTLILDVSTTHLADGFDGPEVLISIDGHSDSRSFHVLTGSAPRALHDGMIGMGGITFLKRLALVDAIVTAIAEFNFAPALDMRMAARDDLAAVIGVTVNPLGNFGDVQIELPRADLAILLAITLIDGMAAAAGVIDYGFVLTNADSDLIVVTDVLENIDGSSILTGGIGTGRSRMGTSVSNVEVARLLAIDTYATVMVALGDGGDNNHYVASDGDGIGAVAGHTESDNDVDMRVATMVMVDATDPLVNIDGGIKAGGVRAGSGRTGVSPACVEIARLLALDTYAGNVVLHDGDDNDRHFVCDTRWHGVERRRGNGSGLCRNGGVLIGANAMTFITAQACTADHVGTSGFMLNGVSSSRHPGAAHENVRTEGQMPHQPGV